MPYTADTLDVLTQQEARDAVGSGGTPKTTDDQLDIANTAVSRRLDQLCGAVVRRTVTTEVQKGCCTAIWLRQGPAYSISSVIEYDGTSSQTLTAETLGTAPSAGYFAERHHLTPSLYSGRIVRRASGYDATFWPQVAITYVAGRYADTASVDQRFKQAAAIMLKNLWRSATPSVGQVGEYLVPVSNFPTFAVPKAALELLSDEILEIPGMA